MVAGISPASAPSPARTRALALGGGYLTTGFGAVASQSVSGYGGGYLHRLRRAGLAVHRQPGQPDHRAVGQQQRQRPGRAGLLGSVALDGAYVTNNLAANRIGAGTIAAGVIYAGDIAASQITSGYIAAARINAGSPSPWTSWPTATRPGTSNHVSFGMGAAWSSGSNCAGGRQPGRQHGHLRCWPTTTATATPCCRSHHRHRRHLARAIVTWGGWNGNTTAPTYATSAYLTRHLRRQVRLRSSITPRWPAATYAGNFDYANTFRAKLGTSTSRCAFALAHRAPRPAWWPGDGSYALNIDNGRFPIRRVTITGPPNNTTTYLRGDGTWRG